MTSWAINKAQTVFLVKRVIIVLEDKLHLMVHVLLDTTVQKAHLLPYQALKSTKWVATQLASVHRDSIALRGQQLPFLAKLEHFNQTHNLFLAYHALLGFTVMSSV